MPLGSDYKTVSGKTLRLRRRSRYGQPRYSLQLAYDKFLVTGKGSFTKFTAPTDEELCSYPDATLGYVDMEGGPTLQLGQPYPFMRFKIVVDLQQVYYRSGRYRGILVHTEDQDPDLWD